MSGALRKTKLRIVIGVYLALWLLTALVGLRQVDGAFDDEVATGSFEPVGTNSPDVPVDRVEFFDFSDLDAFPVGVHDSPWKCRSAGIAVAPFVIVDEAAWQQYPLAGFGGQRGVFWFFGWVRWCPLKRYWVS